MTILLIDYIDIDILYIDYDYIDRFWELYCIYEVLKYDCWLSRIPLSRFLCR